MNKTPTPRTDARWERLCCSGQSWYQIAEEMKLDCRQKERELTAVTEQRDRLAEESKILRGAITGWQNKWECAVELAAQAQADLDEERKEGEEQARLLGMGSEREAKLIAERDLWRAEAQRWREQALDLEAQIETAIKRIQWRQDNLDRGIKELKSDY